MVDDISNKRVSILHPKVRDDFRNFLDECEKELKVVLRVNQGLRTFDEQAVLYAQGRTKPGSIVTNAKPGSSYHQYGLAVDVVRLKDGKADWDWDTKPMSPIASKYGIFWGGHFMTILDKPHFEKTFGINWRTMLDKYEKRDFISGTNYINL